MKLLFCSFTNQRIDMRKRGHIIMIFLVVLISSCTSNLNEQADIDHQFSKLVGVNNINDDLILSSKSRTWSLKSNETITLIVTNNTEDILILPDFLADLQIFRFVKKTGDWEKVLFYEVSFPHEIILNPQDSNQYSIMIEPDSVDIQNQDEWLRFYVVGSNNTLSQEYGAFIDLYLERGN